MSYCPTPTLNLNLALTGDGAFLFSLKKTHSVWFISVLNYGDTENVLINHLLLVIPMSYPCHYTNLCPHKPHKHAHTHTHTHTNTQKHIYIYILLNSSCIKSFTWHNVNALWTKMIWEYLVIVYLLTDINQDYIYIYINEWKNEWMNEWKNEWCIYIALYCVLLYTQSTLQSCGGGGGGGLSSITTSVQHPLGWWS